VTGASGAAVKLLLASKQPNCSAKLDDAGALFGDPERAAMDAQSAAAEKAAQAAETAGNADADARAGTADARQKVADDMRARQAQRDTWEQAQDQARAKLTAIQEKAKQQVDSFQFHHWFSNQSTGKKIGSIFMGIAAGLGGKDISSIAESKIKQDFEKQRAELTKHENIVKARRDGVKDFDEYLHEQRTALDFKESNAKLAAAQELEATADRLGAKADRSKVAATVAKLRQDAAAQRLKAEHDYGEAQTQREHYRAEEAMANAHLSLAREQVEATRDTGTPEINTKQAALAAEEAHVKRALNPSKVIDAGTFADYWTKRWWPTVTGRPSVIEEKEIHYRLHLEQALGKVKRSAITDETLAKLRKALLEGDDERDKMAEKSVRNVFATLRKALVDAVAWKCLAALPSFPKFNVADPEWDHLTRAEVDQFLAAARDQRDRLLIHFAVKTGARAGEQLALQWGDVDWRKQQVRFQRSRTRGETGPTKSKKHRTVPLSHALLGELRATAHVAERPAPGVRPRGRERDADRPAPRDAVAHVEACRPAGGAVARPPAFVRVQPGRGRVAAAPGAELDGAQHDQHDDAVRPPRAGRQQPHDRGARRGAEGVEGGAGRLSPGLRLRCAP
jgi:integrase